MSIPTKQYGDRSLERREPEYDVSARRTYEEYAYVIDYLPTGRPAHDRYRHMAAPTVQAVGEIYFTLLELEPKHGTDVVLHERLYVGKDKRDKVERIIGRIGYDELTATAKVELPSMLEELVEKREGDFVDFFNRAQPITPRMHSLELLPGIGKKSMWHIIDTRERKPFESFKDIRTRAGITDPARTIARRIVEELVGKSKYRLFVRAT